MTNQLKNKLILKYSTAENLNLESFIPQHTSNQNTSGGEAGDVSVVFQDPKKCSYRQYFRQPVVPNYQGAVLFKGAHMGLFIRNSATCRTLSVI